MRAAATALAAVAPRQPKTGLVDTWIGLQEGARVLRMPALVLDEFHVHDPGDGAYLGRLVRHLDAHSIPLIVSSTRNELWITFAQLCRTRTSSGPVAPR